MSTALLALLLLLQEPLLGRLAPESWPETLQRELRSAWHASGPLSGVCLYGRVREDGVIRFERIGAPEETSSCIQAGGIGWAMLLHLDRPPTAPERARLKRELARMLSLWPAFVHLAVFWWDEGDDAPAGTWHGPQGHGITRLGVLVPAERRLWSRA